jgi:prepilin-type processing-associated H-X9-DG protein
MEHHPNARTAAIPKAGSAQTRPSQPAFTLTELLAVIATTALLAAAVLPAWAHHSKTDVQQIACLNNKRQLSLAWLMYASDNSTRLATTFEWVAGNLNFSPRNTDNTNLTYLAKGQLGPYLRGLGAYKCPLDQSIAFEGLPTALWPRSRSASMSQALCLPSNQGWVGLPWNTYYKSTQLINPAPANLWVFIDENPDSINDGAFAVYPSLSAGSAAFQDGPSVLHDGGCCFGFADGHAEAHQWEDPRTIAVGQTHYANDYEFGTLTPGNLDVAWLQYRTTANQNGQSAW